MGHVTHHSVSKSTPSSHVAHPSVLILSVAHTTTALCVLLSSRFLMLFLRGAGFGTSAFVLSTSPQQAHNKYLLSE